ncbi:MAG: VWA domain-containing protein, partial [Planctomycetota bacterium]|nr:VWA domain-containing protein [Planctomycetota bacterium]
NILKTGESSRPEESSPRWQAGFDLAMGRVMAVKVRTDAYNVMLAKAKNGLKPKDPKTNVWNLEAADTVNAGSRMTKFADKAKTYLTRVVEDHPGTPWALMAQRELDTPIGWQWVEEYDPPPKPMARPAGNNNNNNNIPQPGRDEKAKMLARPKAKRPPPKL